MTDSPYYLTVWCCGRCEIEEEEECICNQYRDFGYEECHVEWL